MSGGLSPLSEAPSLEGVASEDRVEMMVQWFFENFEDPAQEMPYDGREVPEMELLEPALARGC
ncbi:MAG: hypothetical protein WC804_05170 [Sphingomonas sp.]|jgi:hypothetical protein|uniref:hypothetical protein n=1 Tax=Sphingomonas sp. TaxID=28214 RepID=UPI00356A069E